MPIVVSIDHHSNKIATTTNSLTSAKSQHELKYLVLIASCFTEHIHTYVRTVYKESPMQCKSIEIKDHKFWRFKTLYITTTLQNLGTSLIYVEAKHEFTCMYIQAYTTCKYLTLVTTY